MMQRSLLLGAGNSREKKIGIAGEPWKGELITLDMNPNCGASMVWDLEDHPLPFEDESFDEIAAYDVLEHIGKLGDWRGWFDEMSEYHRLLKHGGYFGIIVPINNDAFGDPGHTRFFSMNQFFMLDQGFYERAIKDDRPVTDYRWYWKKQFDTAYYSIQNENNHIGVLLRKP